MSVDDVEGEHDGVLRLIEVGYNVDVHGTDHHSDASQHQEETQLQVGTGEVKNAMQFQYTHTHVAYTYYACKVQDLNKLAYALIHKDVHANYHNISF